MPIDLFIQNLTTKGKSPEDILQILKICYEDDEENVAAATTSLMMRVFDSGSRFDVAFP